MSNTGFGQTPQNSRYSFRPRKSATPSSTTTIPSLSSPQLKAEPARRTAIPTLSDDASEHEKDGSDTEFVPQGKSVQQKRVRQPRSVTGKRKRTQSSDNANVRSVPSTAGFIPQSGPSWQRPIALTPPFSQQTQLVDDTLERYSDSCRDKYRPLLFDWRALATVVEEPNNVLCAGCGHFVMLREGPIERNNQVDLQIEGCVSDSGRLPDSPLTAWACPNVNCNTLTCIACRQVCTQKGGSPGTTCCDRGWYVTIWMLFCYFDRIRGKNSISPLARGSRNKLEVKPQASTKAAGKSSYKASKSKRPFRRGYDSPSAAGTGYAEDYAYDTEYFETAGVSVDETAQQEEKECGALKLVIAFLQKRPATYPWPVSDLPADRPEQDPLIAMFHWTKILKSMAGWLQVGSIEEAHRRPQLLTAVMELSLELYEKDDTRSLVTERTLDAWTPMALTARGDFWPRFQFIRWDQYEQHRDVSIQQGFANLSRLALLQLEAATSMPLVFQDAAGQSMLSLCQSILDTARRLGSAKQNSDLPQPEEEQPTELQGPEAFAMVDSPTFKTAFAGMQKKTEANDVVNPKRMRALFQDIGMLRTSLPVGVFVRAASDRPDMLKVMIIGVQGTPYENGLFEFLVLCPPNYPAGPPSVTCTTAARPETRRYPLNPNLYSTGFVCLSLIGTWQGAEAESWRPGQSSLLQVLISIQSMILGTEMPANNEPGGLSMSHKQYNQGVQVDTVCGGMLAWLQMDELRRGVWKDVVNHHFKKNGNKILSTVKRWSRNNPSIMNLAEHPRAYYPAGLAAGDDLVDSESSSDESGPPLSSKPPQNTGAKLGPVWAAVKHPPKKETSGTAKASYPPKSNHMDLKSKSGGTSDGMLPGKLPHPPMHFVPKPPAGLLFSSGFPGAPLPHAPSQHAHPPFPTGTYQPPGHPFAPPHANIPFLPQSFGFNHGPGSGAGYGPGLHPLHHPFAGAPTMPLDHHHHPSGAFLSHYVPPHVAYSGGVPKPIGPPLPLPPPPSVCVGQPQSMQANAPTPAPPRPPPPPPKTRNLYKELEKALEGML